MIKMRMIADKAGNGRNGTNRMERNAGQQTGAEELGKAWSFPSERPEVGPKNDR